MIRRICIFISIIVGIFMSAYGGNKYSVADGYLQDGDHEMANKEYLKIMGVKGLTSLSEDVRAMTGAFITYYMLEEYKKSFSLCKRVLKLQSYQGSAIFYAGQNLEALGNIELAKKLYKYYTVLSNSDPYRPFIKARFDFLKQREIVKKITSAIQSEGRTNIQEIPDNTLAILYFVNDSEDEKWSTFNKGLCQLMINDLSYIKNIDLVERAELHFLLDELQFDQTQLMDENILPRFGRLLKAKNVVGGYFIIDFNLQITINVVTVNLDQPDKIEQTEFTGKLSDVFQLEKQILATVLTEMDVPVLGPEKGNMNRFQTKNIDAFLAYCEGLDAYDLGDYSTAVNQFSFAAKLDSRFYLANEMQQTVDAMITIEQGNLGMSHFQIIKKSSFAIPMDIGTAISITRARLENISYNLDLGYLPGNDSRKGAAGLDLSNIITGPTKLPKPPNPPPN